MSKFFHELFIILIFVHVANSYPDDYKLFPNGRLFAVFVTDTFI